jgi:ribosomal protein S18 acetylase RimI-like enzyme
MINHKECRLEIYNNDDLDDKIDEILDFVNTVIPDENFDKDDFIKLYGNYAIYKNIYLYYYNDELIGVSSCNFYLDDLNEEDHIIYMMVIAIKPTYHNCGIGTIFLNKILNMNNQSNIWVKIHKNNMQSQHFFMKNNFEKTAKKNIPSVLNPSYRKPYNTYVHYKE